MNTDVFTIERRNIRGTDSNSLLRMYDLANHVFQQSPLQQERERAATAIQRIAKELRKRNVSP